jgi:hypothetical protein
LGGNTEASVVPGKKVILNKDGINGAVQRPLALNQLPKTDAMRISTDTIYGCPVINSKKVTIQWPLALCLLPKANPKRIFTDTIYNYTICKGATLSVISDRFHWPVDSIRRLNNIKGDFISEGGTLKIKMKVIMKITSPGQTLDSIALQTRTDKKYILNANAWSSEPELRQGDVVIVPF